MSLLAGSAELVMARWHSDYAESWSRDHGSTLSHGGTFFGGHSSQWTIPNYGHDNGWWWSRPSYRGPGYGFSHSPKRHGSHHDRRHRRH